MEVCIKKGFTLAEILITLGIIGIVAAMTIPTVVANYKKKLFITKAKSIYSIMANVIEKSVAENGDIKYWDLGTDYSVEKTELTVQKYIEPYLKVADHGKYFLSGIGNFYYTKLQNGITIVWLKDGQSIDGQPPNIMYAIVSFNGNISSMTDESRDYSHNDLIMAIMTDRNSLDFFGALSGRTNIKSHSVYGCNENIPANKRLYCGKLLKLDNFEIKEDYPW